MEIKKIVVTGGPCGGKSSAVKWIRGAMEAEGWKVLFVDETATQLLGSGVPLVSFGTNYSFQWCNLRLQIEKEEVFARAARGMEAGRVLLVCDRGAMDNKAYMQPGDFRRLLAETGYTEESLCARYDAVFHLVSAAIGAEEYYGNATNGVRSESVEEAAALDNTTLAAWMGHPRLRVIGNEGGFEVKMNRLLDEIRRFLAE
jgi:hypothetical protein